jgi:phosphoglycolate phosphatase
MRISGIIFDFDGTLAELNLDFGDMARQVQALARARGFGGPWPRGYLLEAVEVVSAELGDGFAERARRLIESIEVEAAGRARLFDFTRTLLCRATTQGYDLAVVSRNCGPAIRRLLPEVEELAAFLPREKAPRPKPHPGQLWDACAALGLEPRRTAMVGDHPTDMQAAVAAGCLPVGVTSGRVSEPELRQAGAQMVLPHAGKVLEALGREL